MPELVDDRLNVELCAVTAYLAASALWSDAVLALVAAAVWLVVADEASTSSDHFALSVLVVSG